MSQQDTDNFIRMENKLKDYIKEFQDDEVNICCNEAEREKLLSLIPVVKVVGENHDLDIKSDVACAIILVLYYGMNLTEGSIEYKTDILLSIVLNFITIDYAIRYINEIGYYQYYKDNRVAALKREYESSWQQEYNEARGDKDKERVIQKKARNKIFDDNLREKWKEDAEKWVNEKYKTHWKQTLNLAQISDIPKLNITEGQRKLLDKINKIIIDILIKGDKRDARGSPESKIRRVMLGMDQDADPLVWSQEIEKTNPSDLLKTKTIKKTPSLSQSFIPSQKKTLLAEIKTKANPITGGKRKTKRKRRKTKRRRRKTKRKRRKTKRRRKRTKGILRFK